MVATTVPSTSTLRRPECFVDVPAEPHHGERWVGGQRGVDGVERAGEGLTAEVEGVVVGHGRHVDAGGGERVNALDGAWNV